MNRSSVGFAREWAQTISFVESGFTRLGPSYPAVGFCGVHMWLKYLHPWSLSPGGGLEALSFWPIFLAPLSRLLIFSFILVCIHFPSSTCRVDISKTDTCPVNPNPKSLGMVDKADEYDSVRSEPCMGRAAFPRYFGFYFRLVPIPFLPFFSVEFWVCRGLNCPRQHLWTILGFMLLSLDCSPLRLGP